MTNKIDGTTPRSPFRGLDPVSPRTESPLTSPVSAVEETVDLTQAARLMHRLEHTVRSIPEIDHALVEAIRLALSDGSYEIKPQRIAARIVRLERDLLGMP